MSSGAVSIEFEREVEGQLVRARLEAADWREFAKGGSIEGLEEQELHDEHLDDEGGLEGCLVCGHPELFRQKIFPRKIGFVIVILAALLAPFTYYISLFVAAGIDLILYICLPNQIICYVCETRHKGFNPEPRHPGFDREIVERLRFGKKAVMGKPMREGGTAGAPEPEH